MSIWRYNPAEDDYEEIPPDEQEQEPPQDYCSICQHKSCCEMQCVAPSDAVRTTVEVHEVRKICIITAGKAIARMLKNAGFTVDNEEKDAFVTVGTKFVDAYNAEIKNSQFRLISTEEMP